MSQVMPPLSSSNPTPAVAIVIPTFNRIDALLEALRHLEAQTWKDFEVVVVDDGSTDTTRQQVEQYRQQSPLALRFLEQANAGPAKARNLGLAQVKARVSILIGDDIFPDPDFVRVHWEHHERHPELEAVALGLTRWARQGQEVTPFMRWLEEDGVQFHYRALLDGEPATWQHFYTSNLSFKTAYLQANPFHEGFPYAAMEDIELGYRLHKEHGLSMTFLPGATADHLHPTNFRQSCRRMVQAGESMHRFEELWPDQPSSHPRGWKLAVVKALTEGHVILPGLSLAADWLTKLWCPNPLMKRVLALHSQAGFQRAAARVQR